jgi:TonB family protein
MRFSTSSAICLVILIISLAQARPSQLPKPRYIKVSGGVLQGSAIKKVPPSYPPLAKAALATGQVQVQITVSERGEVIEAIVIDGHPLLGDAALEAARQWVFKPIKLNTRPVKVQGILTFNFTLTDGDPAALESTPRTTDEYLARGKARLAADDAPGAVADFDKVIELAPDDPETYNERGQARLEKGDKAGALSDFNKAIELDPKAAPFYLNRGLVLLREGKDVESQRDFERGLALEPDLKPYLELQIKEIKEQRARR